VIPAHRVVSTGLGVGHAPLVPGTFGSMLGVVLYGLLAWAGGWPAALAGLAVVTALGFWSAGITERAVGRRDPGLIVIDEVAGQMLSLIFLPRTVGVLAAGFLLFRVFDILKPFPARRLEALPGGSGIMADDLMAGLYANLLLQALVRWTPWFQGS
jgi:phosphatidylglycerophosphatase A